VDRRDGGRKGATWGKSGIEVRVKCVFSGKKLLGKKGGLCEGNTIDQEITTRERCGQWIPGQEMTGKTWDRP
jgi:hypothetical protein